MLILDELDIFQLLETKHNKALAGLSSSLVEHFPVIFSTFRVNVYCEFYNYLTSYLVGKAAILIHSPLNNIVCPFLGKRQPRSQGLSSSRPLEYFWGQEDERPWERGWAKREMMPLVVLYAPRDRLSRIPQLLDSHRPPTKVEYLHTDIFISFST